MRLTNFKTGSRLAVAFLLVLIVTGLVATLAVSRLKALRQAIDYQATVIHEREVLAQQWAADIRLNMVRALAILHSRDAAYVQTLSRETEATSKRIGETARRVADMADDEEARQHIARVVADRGTYTRMREQLFTAQAGGRVMTMEEERSLIAHGEAYLAALDRVTEDIRDTGSRHRAFTLESLQRSEWMIVAGGIVAVLLGGLCSVLVTRSITRPIAGASGVAESVAAGDLTVRVEVQGRDETARLLHSLEAMRGKLAAVVSEVRRNADGLASASREIASGSSDLSARTEQQASALEETAASMEQLNTTVRQNSEHAQRASDLATRASEVAAEGGAVVAQVVQTMRGIADSAGRISEIISVIDGIAFQTNILALNAAVEAARAGEQGRGFAVVASEVRALAQRSAEAAKEIKSLITASVDTVAHGSALADQAGSTMDQVVGAIRGVAQVAGEISAASREQSLGVAQVGQAVVQMDQATQQNAAVVEELSAAAAVLKEQAEHLVRSVAVFRLGADAVVPVAAPTRKPRAAAAKVAASASPVRAKAAPARRLSAPTPALAAAGADAGWESF
ncbi:methyl-accepting chemotaxis protein [Pseudacidovorax sp. RU35E]|uniref:methyl-accepting chemotaxis protein n=1 Tax=Pseudacidovorax sp. RU35E TaxID=1907403 RepID=UPI0009566A8F|nr:methyl-accepting chemotaxis protein [Pseudacidovorax sp. RU35E]SIQ90966.1 methyl-accepting chemotaxis protein [Pseudacidovorax sp. RU35E]